MLQKAMEIRTKVRDARYYKAKETFQENQIRHLVDALLQAKLEEERDDVTARDIMFDDDIMATIDSIFGAGSETTATTLLWLIAYLVNFPKLQEKINSEIVEIFGCGGRIDLKKRRSCHYLEATLTEVLRCATIVPLFVHKATRDTTLSGYRIPKDTTVLLNIWAINHDEREWENPQEFNPDRFLDFDGHFTGTMKMSYMPFGAGRRVCIGESLAKTELFLISATLLQKFEFANPPGCSPPDLKDGIDDLIFAPKPYKVTGVVGRADILACLLFLLSFLSFIRYNSTGVIQWLSIGCLFIHGHAQMQGFTVYGVCVVYDVFVLNKGMERWLVPFVSNSNVTFIQISYFNTYGLYESHYPAVILQNLTNEEY
ncbi:hypothetical protein QZH41_005069 [Actinostola sp. cb2023]|nr:hypothetical protein QZH41_005069 [Actinostola sp. cb2023]